MLVDGDFDRETCQILVAIHFILFPSYVRLFEKDNAEM